MKRISFSYPLPQAIREGRKTQTRREIKPQPKVGEKQTVYEVVKGEWWVGELHNSPNTTHFSGHSSTRFYPPYKVGDVLAVLEEHYMFGHWEPDNTRKRKTGRQSWKFVQDSQKVLYRENPPTTYRKGRHSADPSTSAWHKRLARFMPAHAVRTYIQLTNIKVERLGDISEEDAIKEGIKYLGADLEFGGVEYPGDWFENYGSKGYCFLSAQDSFRSLWQFINGEGSWNPKLWVWVFEFKQVEKPIV